MEDFVQIDRNMLNELGFHNTIYKLKNVDGTIRLKDTRIDFSNALRCLRNTTGFVEGTSFTDISAHFVVIKSKKTSDYLKKQHGGQNKQSLWIRKCVLNKWMEVSQFPTQKRQHVDRGCVYFIHVEGDYKRFKIGYTSRIDQRLEELQTSHPDLLVVYGLIKNVTKKKETQLHHMFKKYRIRGEWFRITTDMIDAILQNNDADNKVLNVHRKQKKIWITRYNEMMHMTKS